MMVFDMKDCVRKADGVSRTEAELNDGLALADPRGTSVGRMTAFGRRVCDRKADDGVSRTE
jgi:hypothetical protein